MKILIAFLVTLFALTANGATNTFYQAAGHSIVGGYGSIPFSTSMGLTASYGTIVTNTGRNGWQLVGNESDTTIFNAMAGSSGYKRTITLMAGINDIAVNTSVATTSNSYRQLITNLRSTYPDIFIILQTEQTIDWEGNTTLSNRAVEFNIIVATNALGADSVVDMRGESRLHDPSNLTYFQADNVHLTDAGEAIIGDWTKTNLLANNRLIGGTNYYVRKDGNNSNDGLANNAGGAWLTIQWAANTMVAGDTVTVDTGTYAENVDVTTADGASGSPITFQASGEVNVQAFYFSRPWIVVQGFRLNGSNPARDGLVQSSGSAGVLGNAHNIVIRSNLFVCDVVGQYHLLTYATNWMIASNIFLQTWKAGCALAGIGHTVTNNYFSATNGADCFYVLGPNMRITGNTIHNWGGRTVANENLKVGMTYYFVSTNGAQSDFSNVGAGTWPYVIGESYFGGHDGFTATGTTPNAWGGTVLDTSNHPDLIQGSASYGYPAATNNLFDGNRVSDLHAAQMGNISDDGSTGNVGDWTFRNNVFVRVDRTMNLFAAGFKFFNNTFYRSPTNQSQTVIYGQSAAGTASNTVFLNNIFFECSDDPASTTKGWYGGDVLSGQLMDYNLVIGTGAGTTKAGGSWNANGREAHGINGSDPLFVNAAGNDFRLQSGSPAIGAGTNLSAFFTTDKNGVARGSVWDIGAFEYQAEPQPTTLNVNTLTVQGQAVFGP